MDKDDVVKADLLDRAVGALEVLADANADRVECAIQTARLWRLALLTVVLTAFGAGGVMTARNTGWLESVSLSPAVAVIPVVGKIARDADVAAERIVPLIDKACADDTVRAVVLRIDSGGGSPSEAQRIGDALARCGKTTEAHVDGAAASGGYMIAMRATHVSANRYAEVGSIGVIVRATDYSGLAEKLGVRETVFASSDAKAAWTQFGAVRPGMEAEEQAAVDAMAAQFHADVRAARGNKLRGELQDGQTWLAGEALERGLVDELGSLEDILASRYPGTRRMDLVPEPIDTKPLAERLIGAAAEATVAAIRREVIQ